MLCLENERSLTCMSWPFAKAVTILRTSEIAVFESSQLDTLIMNGWASPSRRQAIRVLRESMTESRPITVDPSTSFLVWSSDNLQLTAHLQYEFPIRCLPIRRGSCDVGTSVYYYYVFPNFRNFVQEVLTYMYIVSITTLFLRSFLQWYGMLQGLIR